MPTLGFYNDATTGLFTQIGKLVKLYNKCKTDLTTGSTGLNDVVNEALAKFTGNGLNDEAINNLVPAWQSWRSQQIERRSQIADMVLARLTTRDVLDKIGAISSDVDEVLYKLVLQMRLDKDASINATVEAKDNTSWGSPAVEASGVGGTLPGKILVTYLLDGVSSPGSLAGIPMMAHEKYKGQLTELVPPDEDFRFRVTADAQQDGLEEGSEIIAWEGRSASEPHSVTGEGAGLVATFSPINNSGIIQNGSFEDGTGSDADEWTYNDATHITAVTLAASAFRGSRYIRLASPSSSPTDLYITQAIPKASLIANRRYFVSLAIKKGTATIGGEITLKVEGTGFTPTEFGTISQSSLSTSVYTLRHFFVTMPTVIPDDMVIKFLWDDPGVSQELLIDDVAMGPVTYGAGIGVAAVRGATPFIRGQQYTLDIPDYTEGVFQSFFRRAFGVQLPSDVSNGIDDALAG